MTILGDCRWNHRGSGRRRPAGRHFRRRRYHSHPTAVKEPHDGGPSGKSNHSFQARYDLTDGFRWGPRPPVGARGRRARQRFWRFADGDLVMIRIACEARAGSAFYSRRGRWGPPRLRCSSIGPYTGGPAAGWASPMWDTVPSPRRQNEWAGPTPRRVKARRVTPPSWFPLLVEAGRVEAGSGPAPANSAEPGRFSRRPSQERQRRIGRVSLGVNRLGSERDPASPSHHQPTLLDQRRTRVNNNITDINIIMEE